MFVFYCRRFAPNVAEVSEEFQRLAVQFENGNLPEYAAVCYLGASKCEKALNNTVSEIHFLLKSARAFVAANQAIDKLCLRSNANEHLNGALSSFQQAISLLPDDSVMKAAIIREMKQIHPNCDLTSNFASPAHRIYDLELSANECIKTEDFVGALEKLTEIFDDITERKTQHLYVDVLKRNEISRLLLLLLLDLPPARQSASNIKLLEHFVRDSVTGEFSESLHSEFVLEAMETLILTCRLKKSDASINLEIDEVARLPEITEHQQILLKKISNRYNP